MKVMFLSNINGTWDSSVLYLALFSAEKLKVWEDKQDLIHDRKTGGCRAPNLTFDSSVQFSLVAQLCPTLCNLINCSTPGLVVHHQPPEFTQIQVHWVGDAIQLSHLLSVPFSSHLQSFPRSESFPMSQFFTSGGQIIGVSASASVLPMNSQG